MRQEPLPDLRLMHALGFTSEDVRANRAGTLTPGQQQLIASYIKTGRRSTLLALGACVGSVVVLFGVVQVVQPDQGLQQAWPYLVLGVSLFIAMFTFFVALGAAQSRDLRQHHIRVVEGQARRSARTLRQGRWVAYVVAIGKVQFQLPGQEQFDAFQEGESYRIFYIHYPPAHLILAAEQIQQ